MEWYSGSGIDDFVVPEDQEVYDRLPSPESWSKWCRDASESHEFSNNRFLMDSKSTEEEVKFNGETLSNEVGSLYNGKDQSSGSSISGRLSEKSLPQTALSCDQLDYQLDDLSEIEQLDEFFLSSFLEDLPRNENLHSSFHFSPEAECGMASADNRFTDTISDMQSISNDAHGMGSSRYLKTHAFSPSSWEEGEVAASHFNPCNSDQRDLAPFKASLANGLVPSEHDSMIGLADEETSIQQSALQELEMVMAQLNDKTRICFRDALYRLASNSKQHPIKQDQNGDLSMETPGTGEDEKMGSGGKTAIEMETNSIDRAIANLMFSKMDLNIRDFPVSAPVNSKQGTSRETKPVNCSWNQPQGHDLPSYPSFRGDAEVPILGQRYLQTRANPGKHL